MTIKYIVSVTYTKHITHNNELKFYSILNFNKLNLKKMDFF